MKAALTDLEAAVAAGKASLDDMTLSELLERWMEHITGLGRAETTLYHYQQYIDREIAPVLGAIRLSKLKALDIDRLYTKLRKRGWRRPRSPGPRDPSRFAEPGGAVGRGAAQRRQARLCPVTAATRAAPT